MRIDLPQNISFISFRWHRSVHLQWPLLYPIQYIYKGNLLGLVRPMLLVSSTFATFLSTDRVIIGLRLACSSVSRKPLIWVNWPPLSASITNIANQIISPVVMPRTVYLYGKRSQLYQTFNAIQPFITNVLRTRCVHDSLAKGFPLLPRYSSQRWFYCVDFIFRDFREWMKFARIRSTKINSGAKKHIWMHWEIREKRDPRNLKSVTKLRRFTPRNINSSRVSLRPVWGRALPATWSNSPTGDHWEGFRHLRICKNTISDIDNAISNNVQFISSL